jgi:hypothetical protein
MCGKCFIVYNNPLKDLNNLAKFKASQKAKFSSEGYIHPNTGRCPAGLRERMRTNNPMKKPETAAKTSGEKHWSHTKPEAFMKHLKNTFDTLRQKGFISKGQQCLYSTLEELNIPFEPEFPIRILGKRGRCFFVDAYIPRLKLALEYDGFYTHRESPEIDKQRDLLLRRFHKITTLRFPQQNLNNLKEDIKEKLKCYNGQKSLR